MVHLFAEDKRDNAENSAVVFVHCEIQMRSEYHSESEIWGKEIQLS